MRKAERKYKDDLLYLKSIISSFFETLYIYVIYFKYIHTPFLPDLLSTPLNKMSLLFYDPLSPICAICIFMDMGHPLEHGQPTRGHILKEN